MNIDNNVKISSFDIANYIIKKSKEQKGIEELTNLKLQKLAFYSHANYLVKYNNPLFDEFFEAWLYGPVLPELYFYFRKYKYEPIEIHPEGNIDNLTQKHKESIDEIMNIYSKLTAHELSVKSHHEAPWIDSFKDNLIFEANLIENKKIQEYYFENPLV